MLRLDFIFQTSYNREVVGHIKDILFFPIAYYFAFWAKIRLSRWNPRVIVITGSSGKTTLFHLVEAQVGSKAHYSHHANSAIGIPFDILDLHRRTLKPTEWLSIIFKAPTQAFKKPYTEKLYIAECDADRPGEAKFLANLLKPEVTLWVSTSRTHSMNFDKLVPEKFKSVEDAIAYEFGYFGEHTQKLLVIDGDSELMTNQLPRTKAAVESVKMKALTDYKISKDGTEFKTDSKIYLFKSLQPKELIYSIEMLKILCDFLQIKFDERFTYTHFPPGRSSLFRGIKNITIIDSTYNANYSSMKAILSMFQEFPAKTKWTVIGDMLEQGSVEQEEHEKLANLLLEQDTKRIVLLGTRVKKYTYPILKEKLNKNIPLDVFENPRDVLDLLLKEIRGQETILFKGARFLEGVIENLLLDKKEKSLLARREKVWDERRRKWGL